MEIDVLILHGIPWRIFHGNPWNSEVFHTGALRYTYKLIFKQDLKENREWGLFTEREGLMQMGKRPFPNSLDPPLSVFTGHIFDETTRSQVKTLRGYLS